MCSLFLSAQPYPIDFGVNSLLVPEVAGRGRGQEVEGGDAASQGRPILEAGVRGPRKGHCIG